MRVILGKRRSRREPGHMRDDVDARIYGDVEIVRRHDVRRHAQTCAKSALGKRRDDGGIKPSVPGRKRGIGPEAVIILRIGQEDFHKVRRRLCYMRPDGVEIFQRVNVMDPFAVDFACFEKIKPDLRGMRIVRGDACKGADDFEPVLPVKFALAFSR